VCEREKERERERRKIKIETQDIEIRKMERDDGRDSRKIKGRKERKTSLKSSLRCKLLRQSRTDSVQQHTRSTHSLLLKNRCLLRTKCIPKTQMRPSWLSMSLFEVSRQSVKVNG